MPKDLKRLSKFLAIILRHQPENFDIVLDEQGFAPVSDIWAVIEAKFGNQFDDSDLASIVSGDQNGKKRYEIVGTRIRAMYGHSQPEIVYPAIIPPEMLYHGTNSKAVKAIRKNGLLSLGRQYVHMTTNLNNATVVAKRQTANPVILKIWALDAHQAGIIFHQAEVEHYLAKTIPPQFIDFPE